MSNVILFGGKGDPKQWEPFNNFYQTPEDPLEDPPGVFVVQFYFLGRRFYHAEGAFQWMKNMRDPKLEAICTTAGPGKAKQAGRRTKLRRDWDERVWDDQVYGTERPRKWFCMLEVVKAKFFQNRDLAKLLLSTGDAAIHENRDDPDWGGGPNFPNHNNWLGWILMDVRYDLQIITGMRD